MMNLKLINLNLKKKKILTKLENYDKKNIQTEYGFFIDYQDNLQILNNKLENNLNLKNIMILLKNINLPIMINVINVN